MRVLAVFREVRNWIPIVLLLAIAAAGYRVFVSAPREEREVLEAAGAAGQRIEEVRAAAARGDDAEVQRRHAEAVERAEELLEACGASCR